MTSKMTAEARTAREIMKEALDRLILAQRADEADEHLCKCHICDNGTEEGTEDWYQYIGTNRVKVKIGKPICENCYDNLKFMLGTVEKEWDE